jgi:catechol 2,3-dioxygenase-like lactoylglutathione lyase family enzyme
MRRAIAHVALVVADYDEAIRFYVDVLGFRLVADEPVHAQAKRWVVVSPGEGGTSVLLARAANDHQSTRVGDQTGGRVFLFLETDDFARDHALYLARGVRFVRPPMDAPYGRVAVFADLYGNLWDLVEFRPASV